MKASFQLSVSTILIFFILPNLYAQQTDIRVHDPVMIRQGDTYYLFCTGRGISVFSSTDMQSWKEEKPVFDSPPEWTQEAVSDFRGHFWAPDISFYDGKYYLYYSVSSFGKNTSAIGLVTNTTLDPDDPNYQWEDQGMIVQSVPGRDLWNAIDPNIITDAQGYPWMTFGSFWEGMKLVKLIPKRTALAEPQEWYTIAKRERTPFTPDAKAGDAAIEAPFIFKKDSIYYLFVSWDYCCRGENSTYKVVVGRSDKVTGPYLDKEGKAMDEGGGSLVIEGNERWAGVGHNSAYTFDGKDYLVFHAYDSHDDGKPKLKIVEMGWDKEGWPVVDKQILALSEE
ncbi:arabinan endo-1,5-alpha-L-arabinosidase [Catalinimonas niigatensis]|uniref:arabinan endo-1,5-alpha-L-arabinosidase n=1 Tax=Catalinimonas niigatensis TaxID=1397264 RepID=UPI0026655C36|nr:arabinan endo-1,5-alpha-L-arabinosidase [Catalinimonas niigatensis]WPP52107.1 arabinan endo-1,5-alpha-L-arabinosidase [Catalinimonas niigatensis]